MRIAYRTRLIQKFRNTVRGGLSQPLTITPLPAAAKGAVQLLVCPHVFLRRQVVDGVKRYHAVKDIGFERQVGNIATTNNP